MPQYTIGVQGLEVWSPTGVHVEERLLKVKLVVSATLHFPGVEHLPVSLASTFDYSRLVLLINDVCLLPHLLLEQLAADIITKLRTTINIPSVLHLRIEKHHPMHGMPTRLAFIEVTEDMMPGKMRRQ